MSLYYFQLEFLFASEFKCFTLIAIHKFIIMSNINFVQWISQGFGGGAPNKLKASAEGRGASFASDACRRHGRKLVCLHLCIIAHCTEYRLQLVGAAPPNPVLFVSPSISLINVGLYYRLTTGSE